MNQERIGNFIKEIRKKNNLTQKEFADIYNVSFQAVSKWENGKNIPDITLLKQICNDNHVSIDEILNGEIQKNNKHKKTIIMAIIVILLIVFIATVFLIKINHNNNFEFKKITTTCSSFKITGSAAYNKDKTFIYISNIEFCGEDENEEYKELEYTLFENYNETITKISSGEKKNHLTLEDYLRKLKINVNGYSQICKNLSHSELSLEINVTDQDDKIITYKIPLSLEENCE